MYSVMSQWMLYLSRGIDGAAALLIGMAAVEAAIRVASLIIHRHLSTECKEEVRLSLGLWLSLALEFEIAADIVRTAIAPGWDEIGKLAAIMVLRTVLNYFLQSELSRAALRDHGGSLASVEKTGEI